MAISNRDFCRPLTNSCHPHHRLLRRGLGAIASLVLARLLPSAVPARPLLGMGASLLGTYTIVGTLAAKALTQSATVVGIAAPVQALDLLIVQANTNTLAAHFVGLCASLRLLRAASACEDLIDTA